MLKQIFTWWSGTTVGAAFDIGRRAGFVGTDEYSGRGSMASMSAPTARATAITARVAAKWRRIFSSSAAG